MTKQSSGAARNEIKDPRVIVKLLDERARQKVLFNCAVEKYKDVIENGDEELINHYYPTPEEQEIIGYVLKAREKKADRDFASNWVFMTINPPDAPEGYEETYYNLIMALERFLRHKWIEEAWYCIEQRARVEPFYGVHAHMLFERNKKRPSEIKREAESSFRKLFKGEKIKEEWLNIRFCPKDDEDKLFDYISGMKKGLPKKRYEADCAMRKKLGIDNRIYYVKSDKKKVIKDSRQSGRENVPVPEVVIGRPKTPEPKKLSPSKIIVPGPDGKEVPRPKTPERRVSSHSENVENAKKYTLHKGPYNVD